MNLTTRCALLAVAATWLAGCHPVSEAEFEALRDDYLNLKVELREWASDPLPDGYAPEPSMQAPFLSVYEWQGRTWQAICDIVRRNPAAYDPETTAYCDVATDPNGDPRDPPAFGQ